MAEADKERSVLRVQAWGCYALEDSEAKTLASTPINPVIVK